MSFLSCVFDMKSVDELLSDRGLENGGKVQKEFDTEILRLNGRYVPFLTGALQQSAWHATEVGSGVVVYKTPYAHKQYYEGRVPDSAQRSRSDLRGRYWFERMKLDHKAYLCEFVAQRTGGKTET